MSEFSCLHGNERYETCDDAARTPDLKLGLLPSLATTVRMIMILPYGAGGEPGRGEIPMIRCSTP